MYCSIVARSQDSKFIFKVIDLIRDILTSKNFKNDIYLPFMPTMKYKREIPDYSSDYKNLDAIKVTDDNEKNTGCQRIKSKFKGRKGNNKVFILLDRPIDDKFKAKVTLEFKTPSGSNQKCKQEFREIYVKKKNPYTLQFLVADDLLTSKKVIRVNLFLEENSQTNQFGSRLLKCESEKDEILTSCILIMKQNLGLNTIEELDAELARRFKHSVPIDDLNRPVSKETDFEKKPIIEDLLTGDLTDQLDGSNDNATKNKETSQNSPHRNEDKSKLSLKIKSKDHEHPTLLHLAADYNLNTFATSLLEFKPSIDLCSVKNCSGLTPFSIAKLNGHKEICHLLEKYTKRDDCEQGKLESSKSTGKLICDLDYVNLSVVEVPSKDDNQTSDFTSDSSDQSSVDGTDSVDGLIKPRRLTNDYDFITKTRPIRLCKLIDLDTLSSSDNEKLLPPKTFKIAKNPFINECNEYDIVKTSPIRANVSSPSQSKIDNCKSNLFERFNDLRISSSSSASSNQTDDQRMQLDGSLKSVNQLETTNLSESQIELMKLIKAFKMGLFSNDQMESSFKQWASKYKYKIDHNNQFESETLNRMGKRSVSSSHLLCQDSKLEFKDSGCSSRLSTMKTCLSNINLNANSSKFHGKQFSLTDWFHQLTAKLTKQKNEKNDTHKSPKFEKKEKINSPSKLSSNWTKRLSSSNVLAVRKSLTMNNKDFEKLKPTKSPSKSLTKSPFKSPLKSDKVDIQTSKIKSMTLPLRNQPAKNQSPTSKLKNKLNFKKNSKSSLLNENDKSKVNCNLNERFKDKLKDNLKERLSTKLNDRMCNLTDKLADNLNHNLINNKQSTRSIGYSSLDSTDSQWAAYRVDENNKIICNLPEKQNSFSNEYDRIPVGPPVLANCRKV